MNKIKLYVRILLQKRYPKQYNNIAKLYFKITSKKSAFRLVSKHSTMCIEGFPRSANSFTVAAFKICSGINNGIATHMHSHTNILEAIKLGVPTLVLVRKPEDAVVSLKVLSKEDAIIRNEKHIETPIYWYLEWYIIFYSSLLEKKNHFVIGKFEDVTTNFSKIITDFNDKYSTNFKVIEDVVTQVKNIDTKKPRNHIFPTEFRENEKKTVKDELKSEKVKKLIKEANKVYELFVS
jgi:hypothetical protein